MQSKHCLVLGPSDGGKSTLVREVIHETPIPTVTVNFRVRDEIDDKVPGRKAGSADELYEVAADYDDWKNVKVNYVGDDPLEMTDDAVRFALDVWDTAGVPVQIAIDECHHVIGEGNGSAQENAGMWALAEGRDKGIKLVLSTQNAQKLEYEELMNVKYWAWVGEYASAQEGFMRYWGIDQADIPNEPYEYVVLNRGMETLYSGRTKEQYA